MHPTGETISPRSRFPDRTASTLTPGDSQVLFEIARCTTPHRGEVTLHGKRESHHYARGCETWCRRFRLWLRHRSYARLTGVSLTRKRQCDRNGIRTRF